MVLHSWQKHLLTFLMVFGPGLIVMEADYLIQMTLMLGYHAPDIAGILHRLQ
jgi:hypothetical protein